MLPSRMTQDVQMYFLFNGRPPVLNGDF